MLVEIDKLNYDICHQTDEFQTFIVQDFKVLCLV